MMLFDRVTSGGVEYRAHVVPLRTEENLGGAYQMVKTWFRVILPPEAEVLDPSAVVTWRGLDYQLHGDVEPHTINGRLHHVELIMLRVTG